MSRAWIRQDEEYFRSPVFTLIRARVGVEVLEETNDTVEACTCHHHTSESLHQKPRREGNKCNSLALGARVY
jgi:hypothetical protein